MKMQEWVRSIPACTGKPDVLGGPLQQPRVYPRVYGETLRRLRHVAVDQGLSPRVRGNREVHQPIVVGDGSIPACTGKPAGPPW